MAKRKRQSNDIKRRLADAPYSVDYFARKHDISIEQARELMRKLAATATNSTRRLQGFSQVRSVKLADQRLQPLAQRLFGMIHVCYAQTATKSRIAAE